MAVTENRPPENVKYKLMHLLLVIRGLIQIKTMGFLPASSPSWILLRPPDLR